MKADILRAGRHITPARPQYVKKILSRKSKIFSIASE